VGLGFKLIKWMGKSMCLLIGVLPLCKCQSGYRNQDGKIKFNGKEISDKNFVILNACFGKTDTAVFYKEHNIDGANPASFIALDEQYALDQNKVFYCDEKREGQNYYLTKRNIIFEIEHADPTSFSVLGNGYARDRERAYYKGQSFEVKDPGSLKIMQEYSRFVKDGFQVYFEQSAIPQSEPSSFQILNNHYARDLNSIYYFGFPSDYYHGIHRIPCVVNEFRLLDYPYSRDRGSAFYFYHKIEGSNAESFSVISFSYSKDKEQVYVDGKVIKGADPHSFSLLGQDENSIEPSNYAKDKNRIFWKDKTLSGAKMESFRILGQGYSCDNGRVYFENRILSSADPSSFKLSKVAYGDYDAEDGNNKFAKGKKLD